MSELTNSTDSTNGPILCVMVVGFHHKKGCIIEYCFPNCNFNLDIKQAQQQPQSSESQQLASSSSGPNQDDDNNDHQAPEDDEEVDDEKHSKDSDKSNHFKLPSIWKTLPSMALPDGAHNYDRDTIYFHLPHPLKLSQTVFGISCYRQISTDKLQNKSSDITRGTVQKSVVVVSELPLFGLIAAKCEMITYAYFNEFDFTKVDSLKELYYNLNGLLTKDYLNSSEVFLGLSPRDLIITFQHKILILFKLILLEKKVNIIMSIQLY